MKCIHQRHFRQETLSFILSKFVYDLLFIALL